MLLKCALEPILVPGPREPCHELLEREEEDGVAGLGRLHPEGGLTRVIGDNYYSRAATIISPVG